MGNLNETIRNEKRKDKTRISVIALLKEAMRPKIPPDTEASEIRKEIERIAVPAFMELFLTQLCSMVSTMIVGNLGTWAVASVGYCVQPRFLLLAVFIAMSSGATALVARFRGAKEKENANTVMHQSMLISLLFSLLLAVIGYTFARHMVILMGAENDITIEHSTQYMRILMATFPANALTMSITAALRGVGKTKISLIYNMAANVINVVLAYTLVYGKFGFPRLEVAGAGIALGAGQVSAAVIAVISLMRGTDILKLRVSSFFKIDFGMIRRMVKIGTPAMFEQFMQRAGVLLYTRAVASLGTDVYATHQIIISIHTMSFMNGQAFGISATSLLGQSLGRKRLDQGKVFVYYCRKYSLYISAILAALFIFFGRPLVGLYSNEPFVIDLGTKMLFIVACMQPLQSSQLNLSGALRGAGDTRSVALCTLLCTMLLRPLCAILLIQVAHVGLIGAWMSMFADQLLRSVYTLFRYAYGKWEKIQI